MKIFFLLISLISFNSSANYLEDNLRKENWGGVEVIWLEDDSYPLYDISIYFEGGAYTDSPEKLGETALAFELLTAGTERYKQNEILDSLEFYGTSYQPSVTHEFSSYNISGLVKDSVPTMKMMCHLFRNATYPEAELKKSVNRMQTGLRNLPSNHGALANRIFRELSLAETGYEHPMEGNLKTLGAVRSSDLLEKLKFFNDSVKKRIYIKGPKEMSSIKSVFENDCKWGKVENAIDLPAVTKKARKGSKKTVYLAPVERANQAQIRIGNFMTSEEVDRDHELRSFTAQYVGGGFTSRLMQKVRVEKGLTYSIGAYASEQSNYGRKGVNTFTKNETLVETLQAIDGVLEKAAKEIKEEQFQMSKRFAKGSYLFGLESTSAFLSNLIYFDHIGREYEEIYQFPSIIDGLKRKQVKKKVSELFSSDEQITLVVGSKDLKQSLEKAGYKVQILDYKDYL